MLADMIGIFESANESFLKAETDNIMSGVSERSLCGSLMLYVRAALVGTPYEPYHVDVEYNRNMGGIKTIINGRGVPVSICCDLIVHSRGESLQQDNLIALEMKRNTHPRSEKDKDKIRLKCLTKDSFDGVWSADGTAHPEHVCRYVLGVYYELNTERRQVALKYYAKGAILKQYEMGF